VINTEAQLRTLRNINSVIETLGEYALPYTCYETLDNWMDVAWPYLNYLLTNVLHTSFIILSTKEAVPFAIGDIPALCDTRIGDVTITISGKEVKKQEIAVIHLGDDLSGLTPLPDNFCRNMNGLLSVNINALTSLTSIGSNVLYNCPRLNVPLAIPHNVTVIGDSFCYNANMLNSPVILPSALSAIGWGFLEMAHAFNQPLALPAALTSVNMYFLSSVDNMRGPITVDCPASVFAPGNYSFVCSGAGMPFYKDGCKVTGAYADELLARFPKRTAAPYRNLIKV
jgi:hypothetical protein